MENKEIPREIRKIVRDVPYVDVHPHSNICSKGTVVGEDVRHDEYQLHRQLEWTKNRY